MTVADRTNPPRPAQGFSILNLNLRFGLAEDGPNSWPFRQMAYSPLLKAYPSDFYTFQEANDFQVDFLCEQLPGFSVIGQRHRAPDYWQNNVIFHHPQWQCLSQAHFYLSNTPNVPSKFSRSRWPRQCTMATFQCAENKITVITTHFDFDPEVQRRSAVLIADRLKVQAHPSPAVLTGDFNAAPDSSAYLVFSSRPVAFQNAFKPPYAGTHHGFSGTARGGAIDWILFQGRLKTECAAVITDSFNGIYPSDHFPLRAVFRWGKERQRPAALACL